LVWALAINALSEPTIIPLNKLEIVRNTQQGPETALTRMGKKSLAALTISQMESQQRAIFIPPMQPPSKFMLIPVACVTNIISP
jgi:hypothetical protein